MTDHLGDDGVMEPLAEVIDGLFGGLVNPDEVIGKSGPDQADLHVNGTSASRRRKEQQIGLANNAFGTGAGILATGAAYGQARKLTPAKMARSRTGRALIRAKVNPKVAVPATGAALVGIQAANGLMDAQSANYFARELRNERKKSVSKAMQSKVLRRAAKAQERAYRSYGGNILVSEMQAARPKLQKIPVVAAGGAGLAGGLAGQDKYREAKPKVKATVRRVGTKAQKVIDRAQAKVDQRRGVAKADAKKKQAFGWISVTEKDGKPVLDRQNDYISLDEVEKSAYQYVRNSRHGGDMHARMGDAPVKAGEMIESFVVTPEKLEAMGIPAEVAKSVPKGWWGGYQITDDTVWDKIENDERTGFSIHGSGRREERPLEELVKFQDRLEDAGDKARKLSRSKNRQVGFSLGASTLGLTALGFKGGAASMRRVAQGAKVAGTPRAEKLIARGKKFDDLSLNTSIGAAGIGGVGGYNFAAQQRKEASELKRQGLGKRSAQEVMNEQKNRGKEALRRVVQSPRVTQHPEQARRRRQDAAIGGMTASAAGLAGSAALQRDSAIRNTAKYKAASSDPGKKVLLRVKPGDKVGTGAKALKSAQKAARTKTGAAAVVAGGAYASARHRRSENGRRFGEWYS